MGQSISRKYCAVGAVVALAGLGISGAAQADTRVALVIANAKYLHAAHLANPENDADAITAGLKRANFTVDERKNLSLSQMKDALLTFSDLAQQADVAVIYYAGHGIQKDGVDYLIPIDASLRTPARLPLETVPADSVLGVVAEAHKLRLMILDACRDNPFASGVRGPSKGLAPIAISGTVIAYSAKTNTVALDGASGGGNSPYAAALARHLDDQGVELDQMFRAVRDEVMSDTNGAQEPYLDESRGQENFYFMPGSTVENNVAKSEQSVSDKSIEMEMWKSVESSDDIDEYQAYLKHYPDGYFADVAHAKIAAIQRRTGAANLTADFAPARAGNGSGSAVSPPPPPPPTVVASVEKPGPAARRFKPQDFQNVMGLTKQSTLQEAIKLFGDFDHTYSGGSEYRWLNAAGKPWMDFIPGQRAFVYCGVAYPAAAGKNSAVAQLCATPDSQRAGMLVGFTPESGGSSGLDSQLIRIDPSGSSILVRWH